MVVIEAAHAAPDFHAIASARRKRYRYVIRDGPLRDVFARHYSWHCYTRLDVKAMDRAAGVLVGTHDFSSFETSGSSRVKPVSARYSTYLSAGGRGADGPEDAGDSSKSKPMVSSIIWCEPSLVRW